MINKNTIEDEVGEMVENDNVDFIVVAGASVDFGEEDQVDLEVRFHGERGLMDEEFLKAHLYVTTGLLNSFRERSGMSEREAVGSVDNLLQDADYFDYEKDKL